MRVCMRGQLLQEFEAGGAVGTGPGQHHATRRTYPPQATYAQVPDPRAASHHIQPALPQPAGSTNSYGSALLPQGQFGGDGRSAQQHAARVIASPERTPQLQSYATEVANARHLNEANGDMPQERAVDMDVQQLQQQPHSEQIGKGGRRSSLVRLLRGSPDQMISQGSTGNDMSAAHLNGNSGVAGAIHADHLRQSGAELPVVGTSVYARAMAEAAQQVAAAALARFDAPQGLQFAGAAPTPALMQRSDGGKWGGKDFSWAGQGGGVESGGGADGNKKKGQGGGDDDGGGSASSSGEGQAKSKWGCMWRVHRVWHMCVLCKAHWTSTKSRNQSRILVRH